MLAVSIRTHVHVGWVQVQVKVQAKVQVRIPMKVQVKVPVMVLVTDGLCSNKSGSHLCYGRYGKVWRVAAALVLHLYIHTAGLRVQELLLWFSDHPDGTAGSA